ncbi:MAG TPA: TolC family protein [Spirochaetia bacterium]|nr:TolC family protein [Spirochaetia bacterium]
MGNGKRIVATAAILMLILVTPLAGQEKEALTPLSLALFIERVRAYGSFQEILLQELTLVYDRTLSARTIQLLLAAGASYSLDLDDPEGSIAGGTLSVSGSFPETGTTVSAAWETGRGSALAGGGQTSSLLFRVEQNVLKNAFGSADRLSNLMAGHEMTLARYQILESYEDYLAQIIMLYLDWYTAYENVTAAEFARRDASRLLELTREKQRYGVAATLDLHKSRLQLLSAEEELLDARTAYQSTRRNVARLLGLSADGFEYVPEPVQPPAAALREIEPEQEAFRSHSRTVKILALLTEISGEELALSLDDLLPTATVYASYSLDGGNIFPSTDLSNGVTLGFSLSLPLYDPKAEATVGKNRVTQERTRLSEQNQRDELTVQLENLSARITSEQARLSLADQKLEAARLILEEERRRYEQGRVGLDNLLSAQDSFDAIRRARLKTLTALTGDYIEWRRVTDSLVNEEAELTEDPLAAPTAP